jgi:hypothetical protein
MTWKQTLNLWEFFQGVRSWLLLIGFVLLSLALTLKQQAVKNTNNF